MIVSANNYLLVTCPRLLQKLDLFEPEIRTTKLQKNAKTCLT